VGARLTTDPEDLAPDEPGTPDESGPSFRIGEIAEQAGVSTRTVRYYEQVGLLEDVERSPGGTRRYSKRDVEALMRIRELQSLMGFDLDQIRTIIGAERRMDQLRSEWRATGSKIRQRAILAKAGALNDELRAQVDAKIAQLEGFRADLDGKRARYREVALERGLELVEGPATST
jgi:DNA-binding transcriptional MerR regulator